MSKTFTPELAQAVFGQPHKEYEVPQIWDAALSFLREYLSTVMWNIHQRKYESPFSNSGNAFSCQTFKVEAYSWGDDEQPWNFKWGDVEISWYKYLGRGMSANQPLSPDRASVMLDECMQALREYEAKLMQEVPE